MKKLFTLFLALVASVSAIYAQSGTCGNNLTWTLSNGTLTISGTGAMYDYGYDGSSPFLSFPPWYDYRSSILSVIISDSVTSIGDGAFDGCSSLKSIIIPNSVTSIGNEAFYDCKSLTSITIPNSVTSIGKYTFYSCSSLTSVTIPNSVTSIGEDAFYRCSRLNSVTIPNSVTSIGERAFSCCFSLTSVTIGNSVTSIGSYAFDGCSSLKSVVWNAKTISNFALTDDYYRDLPPFHSICSQITSFTFGEEVKRIPAYLCYEMSNLKSVTIPNSVTEIGWNAFSYCTALKSLTIGNSVTSIGEDAFYRCSSLTSITIPNSVTSIGNRAFWGCYGLTSITIPNSIESIKDGTFMGCTSLKSVTIGNSVTSIGEEAFYNCSSLTSVSIPNSVTSIGEWAFYECSSLTSITIPNSVKSIGSNAFRYCSSLTSVAIPNSVKCIEDYAFLGCSSLTSVAIPNRVTSIGNYAFSGCSSLTSVTIGNSVTSIGEEAFYNCSSLTSVTIPNSVTSIGKYAFEYCSGLTSVTIEAETPPVLDGDVFYRTKINTIYVPCNAVNTYKTAEEWSRYADRIYGNCASSYTVRFLNWDGSVLQSKQVETGEIPQYTGATPKKPSDSQYNYTFSGWTPQIVAATADATYMATFTATEIPSEECTDVNDTWLQTGGSGLGEMTTDASYVWFYDAKYGAKAINQDGYIGHLMTPAKDLRGMKSVTLSFMHTHNFAGTPSNELTLWVTPDYKGSIEASQWQQLTIAPYAANTNWTFVSVSINVPVSKVGANTVFAFEYMSTAYNYATWNIKNLTLIAQCEGSTPPQPTSYTIKFKNWDGSVLQSKQVEEGKIPQYTGATPTRPDDSQYTYTFSGWTPQIVAATADATYTATFTATEIPSEECTDVNDTWLQTGGSGLGEMTTDNSGVWFYNAQYGAKGSKQGGYTGYLMTPAKDLRGMKSVTLSFMHTHKFAVTPSNELTLWVTPDYKGSVKASQWQQLTIAPYAANTNWTFVSVSINVPVSKVGANTVFAFKYMSTASNYSTWEIKNLTLIAQCATGEQGIDNIDSSNLQGGDRGRLILRDGQVLILRNGKTYTMQGQEVK